MEFELPLAPQEAVSALAFSGPNPSGEGAERLLVASWDKTVALYDIKDARTSEDAQRIQIWEHEGPVLDVCWLNPDLAASASADRRVRLLDLKSGSSTIIGKHDGPVTKIRYSQETKLLITSGMDCTIKIWDPSSHRLLRTIHALEQVLAMDVTTPSSKPTAKVDATPRLVVGMTNRRVDIYDLSKWERAAAKEHAGQETTEEEWAPEDSRDSSLKFQIKDVKCLPDGRGFATSSVEGRVSVDFFDPSDAVQAKKYAFKCHRQLGADGVNTAYPVSALAFHPTHGSFMTFGGDAMANVWDPQGKRRIRVYPKFAAPLSAAAFSADGAWLAVASGAESLEEDGHGGVRVVPHPVAVHVRRVGDETKIKASKARKG